MKYFFPDSQDQVNPDFNFRTEEHPPTRIRQRDDRYAHEVLAAPPFNGYLVSKTIVDGTAGTMAGAKYSASQRNRLYLDGVEDFFRLGSSVQPLEVMGDCGAFSYATMDKPPYTPTDVIDFYEGCGFDYGISVDHIIFQYAPGVAATDEEAAEWARRQKMTIDLAADFSAECRARKVEFTPLAVAQGWSPASYADAVDQLQRMGYDRIALGGMVPLKTNEILACLRAVDDKRDKRRTQLHLLGISRCDSIPTFKSLGVTSFDSTSAFRQAFKDERDNYYTPERTYVAVRVPQVDGNAKLKTAILSGRIEQDIAIRLERDCLRLLREYDAGATPLRPVLDALRAYEDLLGAKSKIDSYEETLEARPWRDCGCGICGRIGIDIVLFRGSERNKRRGFHNLYVFSERLDRELKKERSNA